MPLTNSKPAGPLAYLRIHGDTVFLGLLALASGISALAHPTRSDLVETLGRIPASYVVWNVLLGAGGVLIIVGLITRLMRPELVGRILCVAAVAWSAFAAGRVYGFTSPELADALLVVAVVVLACALRASALLARATLYVVYPGRKRPDAERAGLVLAGSADPAED